MRPRSLHSVLYRRIFLAIAAGAISLAQHSSAFHHVRRLHRDRRAQLRTNVPFFPTIGASRSIVFPSFQLTLRGSLNDDDSGSAEFSTEESLNEKAYVDAASRTSKCWNPTVRRAMGAIAGAGVLETAYLTYIKLVGQDVSTTALCRAFSGETGEVGGTCGSVLTGPYSTFPGTGIPLASLGLVAYATVLCLSLSPLLGPTRSDEKDDRDVNNRVALVAVTTFMGVFSVFLMSLLLGVLNEQCVYCFLSATFSISLAALAWLGGALPEQPQDVKQRGALVSAAGSLAAVIAAAVLYVGTPVPSTPSSSSYSVLASDGSGRSASASQQQQAMLLAQASSSGTGELPPPITTQSTSRAISIATQLSALDTRFYGAYWCSHCYDQKQALGKEAMAKIPYIECSSEGRNAQTQLCKEKRIPGYPTWEIKGKLYPGEQALDELEEIIAEQQQVRLER